MGVWLSLLIESLTDYYPFGMEMGGRSYKSNDYRFGYTGHEKESDIAEGVYTTQYRLLDTRLGRWLSVDPLFAKYPGMGAYNYCEESPINKFDSDGRKSKFISNKKMGKYNSRECRPKKHHVKTPRRTPVEYVPNIQGFDPEKEVDDPNPDFDLKPMKKLQEKRSENRKFEKITDGDGQLFSLILNHNRDYVTVQADKEAVLAEFKDYLDNYNITINQNQSVKDRFSGDITINIQVGSQLQLTDEEVMTMQNQVNEFFKKNINSKANVTLNIDPKRLGNEYPAMAIYTEGLYRGAVTKTEIRVVKDDKPK